MDSYYKWQMEKLEFNTGFYNLKLFQGLGMTPPGTEMGIGGGDEGGMEFTYIT